MNHITIAASNADHNTKCAIIVIRRKKSEYYHTSGGRAVPLHHETTEADCWSQDLVISVDLVVAEDGPEASTANLRFSR